MFDIMVPLYKVILFQVGIALMGTSYIYGFIITKEPKEDSKGNIEKVRKFLDYGGFAILMYLLLK